MHTQEKPHTSEQSVLDVSEATTSVQMPIISNYTALGLAAMKGADKYLKESKTTSGLFHGKRGRLRAQRLIQYLGWCGISDPAASESVSNVRPLLALLHAIFDLRSGGSVGLAELIANELIQGEYKGFLSYENQKYDTRIVFDSVSSKIFSESALMKAKSHRAKDKKDEQSIEYCIVIMEIEGCISFRLDNTKALRYLLNEALEMQPEAERDAIRALAESLCEKLTCEDLKIAASDLVLEQTHTAHTEDIIENYVVLGVCALWGAKKYLEKPKTTSGLFHGKLGRLRAERLIQYLEWCGLPLGHELAQLAQYQQELLVLSEDLARNQKVLLEDQQKELALSKKKHLSQNDQKKSWALTHQITAHEETLRKLSKKLQESIQQQSALWTTLSAVFKQRVQPHAGSFWALLFAVFRDSSGLTQSITMQLIQGQYYFSIKDEEVKTLHDSLCSAAFSKSALEQVKNRLECPDPDKECLVFNLDKTKVLECLLNQAFQAQPRAQQSALTALVDRLCEKLTREDLKIAVSDLDLRQLACTQNSTVEATTSVEERGGGRARAASSGIMPMFNQHRQEQSMPKPDQNNKQLGFRLF